MAAFDKHMSLFHFSVVSDLDYCLLTIRTYNAAPKTGTRTGSEIELTITVLNLFSNDICKIIVGVLLIKLLLVSFPE